MTFDINKEIRYMGWERMAATEKALETLSDLGIDPKECFLDGDNNLIIPEAVFTKASKLNKEKQ